MKYSVLRNSLLFSGSTPSEVSGGGGCGVSLFYGALSKRNEESYYSSLWYKNNGEAVLPLPFPHRPAWLFEPQLMLLCRGCHGNVSFALTNFLT